MKKLASKIIKRTLRSRNANKIAVLFGRRTMFLLQDNAASPTQRAGRGGSSQ